MKSLNRFQLIFFYFGALWACCTNTHVLTMLSFTQAPPVSRLQRKRPILSCPPSAPSSSTMASSAVSSEGSTAAAQPNSRRRRLTDEETIGFLDALRGQSFESPNTLPVTQSPPSPARQWERASDSALLSDEESSPPLLQEGSHESLLPGRSVEETENELHQAEGRQNLIPPVEQEVSEQARDENGVEDDYEGRFFPEEHLDWEDGKSSACNVTTDLDSFTCLSQFSEHLFEDVGTQGSFLEMGTLLQHSNSSPRSRFSVNYSGEATVLRPLITSREIGRSQSVIGLGSFPSVGERAN